MFENKKKIGFQKKKIGSDTEIRPWIRFPIPSPGFDHSLVLQQGNIEITIISLSLPLIVPNYKQGDKTAGRQRLQRKNMCL